MKIENLADKKILVLGLGREGIDTVKFLKKIFPGKSFGVADQKKISHPSLNGIMDQHFGKNYLKHIKDYEVIIKTPGIPQKLIKPFVKKQIITSQIKIFLDNCPGKIIGITGTKGKSTTTSLIYAILKKAGKSVHLVGNIGKPVLGLLPASTKKDIYVYEMSCHQLSDLEKSPHIAVFLNVYPEHLDYYKNFKDYAKAKSNIFIHQTRKDYLIFNSKNKIVKDFAKKAKAKKIDLNSIELNFKNIPLKGKFNLQNIQSAIVVANIFNIPKTKIGKAISSFKPLSHRLEYVGQFQGIHFYNDSLSTIPEAAIGALNALTNVQTMIVGGFDRGLSFKGLAKKISKSNVRTLILFPKTGEKIWKEVEKLKNKGIKHFFTKNMKKAVQLCYKYTEKNSICLMSNASPSFGIFKDYVERGDLFKKHIKEYDKNHK
ncbi:MAG: UDP-N-acetylmuramoyl-L-alanine--D-glutamate ligase [Patescibacteria group bacterium]